MSRLSFSVAMLLACMSVSAIAAPILTGVQSRKIHGAAGVFDLAINPAIPLAGSVSVEPRAIGAGHLIVFQFDTPITIPGVATAIDGAGSPIGTLVAVALGNEVRVTVTGIPDNTRITVNLTGVEGATNASASIGFLVGDVNGTRSDDIVDTWNIKARTGQATTAANFQYDVTADGVIDAADIASVKGRIGQTIPLAPPPPGPPPVILYTDIQSGPTTGGENNKGIYLSIFGKNIGRTGLGTTVKVFLNNVEVDNYRYLGASRARQDIDQVTVQIGALGGATNGAVLPIKVVSNGKSSNTNLTFTVNAGNIYFVSPTGVDTTNTTSGGTFAAPFKTLQKPGFGLTFSIQAASVSGAYGRVRAGDFIVMRGGSYKDIGFSSGNPAGEGYSMQTLNKSGCPIGNNCSQGGGTSSGPITIMGFPTETAFIDRTNTLGDDKFGGGFSSADSARQAQGFGAWWTITNLKIESGFNDGPINTQENVTNPLGSNWRVVNNELTGFSCNISSKCRAGTIAGSGTGNFWVGNYGHDMYDVPDGNTDLENHGVYINDNGTFEIAYNVFANILGGNGIQIHSSGLPVDNVNIHHNIIHDTGKHGLNMADGSRNNIVIWDNVIYNTAYGGVRFADDGIRGMKVYNNTFYNTGTIGNTPSTASLVNDTNVAAGMFDIRNNIFWPATGSDYNNGCCNSDFVGGVGTFTNNLFFNGGTPNPATTFSTVSLQSNPQFVSTTPGAIDLHLKVGSPAINKGTSAVSAIVTNDFDITTPRPVGAAFDIGAYEQ